VFHPVDVQQYQFTGRQTRVGDYDDDSPPASQQQKVVLETITMLALAKKQTKSKKKNSKETQKFQKFCDSDSECNVSSSKSEKHRRRNWRDTTDCNW
jgi:hypothetical protein